MTTFLSLIFILFFLGLIFWVFKIRISDQIEYEINLTNIKKGKSLRFYEELVRDQIRDLLFVESDREGKIVTYQAPLIYLHREQSITVEYDTFFIKIKSSIMVKKIMSNLTEINF